MLLMYIYLYIYRYFMVVQWFPYACSAMCRVWLHMGSMAPSSVYNRLHWKLIMIDWLCGLCVCMATVVILLVGSSLIDFILQELVRRRMRNRERRGNENNEGGRNARAQEVAAEDNENDNEGDIRERAAAAEGNFRGNVGLMGGQDDGNAEHHRPMVMHENHHREDDNDEEDHAAADDNPDEGGDENDDNDVGDDEIDPWVEFNADIEPGEAIRVTEVLGLRGSISTALLYAGAINICALISIGGVLGMPAYVCRSILLAVAQNSVFPLIWSLEAIDWDTTDYAADTPAITWEDVGQISLGYLFTWVLLVFIACVYKLCKSVLGNMWHLSEYTFRLLEGALITAKVTGLLTLTMAVEPILVGINVSVLRIVYSSRSFLASVNSLFLNPIQTFLLFWATGMLVIFVVITMLLLLRDCLHYEGLARYILPFNPQDGLWKRLLRRPCWKQIISVARTCLVSVFAMAVVLHGFPWIANCLSKYYIDASPLPTYSWPVNYTLQQEGPFWVGRSLEVRWEIENMSDGATMVRLHARSDFCSDTFSTLSLLQRATELPWMECWWERILAPPRFRVGKTHKVSVNISWPDQPLLEESVNWKSHSPKQVSVNVITIPREHTELYISSILPVGDEHTSLLQTYNSEILTEWTPGSVLSAIRRTGKNRTLEDELDPRSMTTRFSSTGLCRSSKLSFTDAAEFVATVEMWLNSVSELRSLKDSNEVYELEICLEKTQIDPRSPGSGSGILLSRLPSQFALAHENPDYELGDSLSSLWKICSFTSRMSDIPYQGVFYSVIAIVIVYLAIAIMMEPLRTILWWCMTTWIEKFGKIFYLDQQLLPCPDRAHVIIPGPKNKLESEVQFYGHKLPEKASQMASLYLSTRKAETLRQVYRPGSYHVSKEFNDEVLKHEVLQTTAEALSQVVYRSRRNGSNDFQIHEPIANPAQRRMHPRDWHNIADEVDPGMIGFAQAHFARFNFDEIQEQPASVAAPVDIKKVKIMNTSHLAGNYLHRDIVLVTPYERTSQSSKARRSAGFLYRIFVGYPMILLIGISSCVMTHHLLVYFSCFLGNVAVNFFIGPLPVLQAAIEFAVGFPLVVGFLNVVLLVYLAGTNCIVGILRSRRKSLLTFLNFMPQTLGSWMLKPLFGLWKLAIKASFSFDLVGEIPRESTLRSLLGLITLVAIEQIIMPWMLGFATFLVVDPLLISQNMDGVLLSTFPKKFLLNSCCRIFSSSGFVTFMIVGYVVRTVCSELAYSGLLGSRFAKAMETAAARFLKLRLSELWNDGYKPIMKTLIFLTATLVCSSLSIRFYCEKFFSTNFPCRPAWMDDWTNVSVLRGIAEDPHQLSSCAQSIDVRSHVWWGRAVMMVHILAITFPLYMSRLASWLRMLHHTLYIERYRTARRLLDFPQ